MRKLRITNVFKVPEFTTSIGKNRKLTYLLRSVTIMLMSFLLAHVVIYDLENIASFVSTDQNGDFQMSDIYNQIADYRQVSQASTNVVVVAVDECSRQELLDVLEIVSEYTPKAIGLDVFLRNTY